MRIVFFTGAAFRTDELFHYLFAHIAARFTDVHIVAVCPQRDSHRALHLTLQRYTQKIRRLGVLPTVEILTSYPLQLWLSGRDERRVHALLRQLPRPAVRLDLQRVQCVQTVNGADAVRTLRALQPDIIMQAGAGILRQRIFTLARLATINLHHGIAPLIRGMHSIYWALWEDHPEWLGATVHRIDAGIDTGEVLAYAPVTPHTPGAGYAPLYARATEEGVARLLEVLTRLEAGEQWCLPPPAPGSTYRSTLSGWKLLLLQYKLARQRCQQGASLATPVALAPSPSGRGRGVRVHMAGAQSLGDPHPTPLPEGEGTKPCRFLYLIGQLTPGGSERQLLCLLQQLDRRQYSPHVAVWNYRADDPYVAKLRALKVPLHALPPTGTRADKMLALRRLVRRLQPEIVHSYSSFTNFAAWWATLGMRAVAIGALRSDFLSAEQANGMLLGRLNMRWPRSQIFNNMAAAQMARQQRRFFVPGQLFVIRNGIDVQRFHAVPLPLDGPTGLVGVGSLLPVKRWDRLLRAAAHLRQQGLTFRVRIIGDGPLRGALQQEVQQLGLTAVVKLPGYSDDVPGELAAATFAVHLAATEGCPNAVMEAMACGRAVVAMAAGDVPAIVEDGKTGFVVPQDDEARLVHCLATLITDRQLCRRMGEAGAHQAEHAFGLERLVVETLAAYRVAGWHEHR